MTSPAEAESRATRRLGRDYYRLLAAGAVSNLGDGIGLIAYPWLASAVTRNPFLVALVTVVQRLPWLVFTLPVGVLTDRRDRRTLMVIADAVRAGLTLAVAFVVLGRSSLPAPDVLDDPAAVIQTDLGLYLIVLAATLLLGIAEVVHDNAAQTLMPSLVTTDQLERANGRLWSVEMVSNSFIGPPLGAFLLAATFSLPFFVDSVTFAVAAVFVALIRPQPAREVPSTGSQSWRADAAEGFRWLWRHPLLRTLAITLGMLNMLFTLAMATLVLFAQERLDATPTQFAVLSLGSAIGGVIGGWTASGISARIGTGPSLWLTLLGGGVISFVTGLATSWILVAALLGLFMLVAVLWNVITVSLRQTIIPDGLLGRVNSVYRFFGWGMMPVGALLAGLIVNGVDAVASRDLALQMPWFVCGAGHIVLFAVAAPHLTTAKIEAAREAA